MSSLTGPKGGGEVYRALRAVLDIIHGQFQLRLLADVGLLEEGDAAEEDGVTGALKTGRDKKQC